MRGFALFLLAKGGGEGGGGHWRMDETISRKAGILWRMFLFVRFRMIVRLLGEGGGKRAVVKLLVYTKG